MLHQGFIAATWLIGLTGFGGAIGIIGALVGLGPAGGLALIGTLVSKFLSCTHCVALAVFILATTGAYWVGHQGEYDRGFHAAMAKIAADDAATVARAVEMRKGLLDCQSRGGAWDQTTGECS